MRCARYPRWEAPRAGSPISVSRRNGIEADRPRSCRSRSLVQIPQPPPKKPTPHVALPAMLAGRGDNETLSTVELRQLIRSGMAASAVAHLSVLAVVVIFAEVHPFGPVTAETI